MSNIKIHEIVELICNQGCTSVNSIIEALEQGKKINQATTLNAGERIQLIKELKEIMHVYNKK